MERLLEITGLTKAFAGQLALDNVDLDVERGEILALAGPNGSGKSTLIKVMAGYHQADGGRIVAFGQEVWPNEVDADWKRRIHFIHQVLGLIPTLSATENLALGSGYTTGRGKRIKWREQRRHARELLARFGMDFDIDVPVAALAAPERTVIAIARALDGWETPEGILFVDEPTAALHDREAERLFGAIRNIADEGAGVVFVSHRSAEVLELADRVAVLRDGRLAGVRKTKELNEDGLVEMIAGRRIEDLYPSAPKARAEVVLEVRNLEGKRIRDLSFDLHAGEVLGVAGLNGSGRDELPGLLFGTGERSAGEVVLEGESLVGRSVKKTIDAGLVLVPADRAEQGAVLSRNARENMMLPSLGAAWNGWRLSRKLEEAEVDKWIDSLDVQPPQPEKTLSEFSGGNQQKVVMAKWMRLEPKVIVLDEPTQGVDVAAKAAIYELLAKAAEQGASLIICTSESKPLAALCDRVIVLRDGEVAAVLEGPRLTDEAIVTESVSSSADVHTPVQVGAA